MHTLSLQMRNSDINLTVSLDAAPTEQPEDVFHGQTWPTDAYDDTLDGHAYYSSVQKSYNYMKNSATQFTRNSPVQKYGKEVVRITSLTADDDVLFFCYILQLMCCYFLSLVDWSETLHSSYKSYC